MYRAKEISLMFDMVLYAEQTHGANARARTSQGRAPVSATRRVRTAGSVG